MKKCLSQKNHFLTELKSFHSTGKENKAQRDSDLPRVTQHHVTHRPPSSAHFHSLALGLWTPPQESLQLQTFGSYPGPTLTRKPT